MSEAIVYLTLVLLALYSDNKKIVTYRPNR